MFLTSWLFIIPDTVSNPIATPTKSIRGTIGVKKASKIPKSDTNYSYSLISSIISDCIYCNICCKWCSN